MDQFIIGMAIIAIIGTLPSTYGNSISLFKRLVHYQGIKHTKLSNWSQIKMMLIKLLNLFRDCESVDAPRVNNIGYVLSGYDIYHGNPIPTSGIVDPGFRSLIFQGWYIARLVISAIFGKRRAWWEIQTLWGLWLSRQNILLWLT